MKKSVRSNKSLLAVLRETRGEQSASGGFLNSFGATLAAGAGAVLTFVYAVGRMLGIGGATDAAAAETVQTEQVPAGQVMGR